MPAKPGFISNGELCVRKYSEIKLFAGAVSHNEPGPVTKHERPLWPGYASLTLLFCLATRRCMNLGPSFLYAWTPSDRRSSQTCEMLLASLLAIP
jgi:hypothetical protein